jgi:hypothetical protein
MSNKSSLPSKICEVCLRPFSWRKKWAKDWQQVKYCSKRCSGNRNKQKTIKASISEKSVILPHLQTTNSKTNKAAL